MADPGICETAVLKLKRITRKERLLTRKNKASKQSATIAALGHQTSRTTVMDDHWKETEIQMDPEDDADLRCPTGLEEDSTNAKKALGKKLPFLSQWEILLHPMGFFADRE